MERNGGGFRATLGTDGLLNSFLANPAVTGTYAESWTRSVDTSLLTLTC